MKGTYVKERRSIARKLRGKRERERIGTYEKQRRGKPKKFWQRGEGEKRIRTFVEHRRSKTGK